jgi:hypothetical protein
MRSRERFIALGGLALLLLGGCECGGSAATASASTVRQVLVPRANVVGRVAGVPGDYTLTGPGLRVLIGGMRRDAHERGRVLAIHTPGITDGDDFDGLEPVLLEGDRAHPITVTRVYRARASGRDAVVVSGRVALARGAVSVERVYLLADVRGTLAIHTRVDGDGLSVAERIAWGGQPSFVPFVGRLSDAEWHDAGWIGTEGRARAIVIGPRASEARVRGEVEVHGEETSVDVMELATEARRGRTSRTLLTTARGGLAEALRRFGWARGRPFPEASVTATRRRDASLRVASTEGTPWLRARLSPSGRMQLPLPDDRRPLTVRAVAYGHAASELLPIEAGARVRLFIPPSGVLRVRAIDASTSAPMPFRVRVIGIAGTATPDLGPEWSAAGARDIAVSVGGPIALPMPVGKYELVVTHGPEYPLTQRVVVVTGAREADLTIALERAVDPGEWIACDLHLHAEASSDSHVALEDRVASLVAEGIRFAVPTDHNYVTDYAPAIASLGADLATVTGVEVTTWDPAFGHFNAFPYPIDRTRPRNGAPEFSGLTPGRLFAGLREESPGVVVQVNHPRLEPNIGYFDHMGVDPVTRRATGPYSDDFDTLEVWNGFDLARMANVERNLAEWIGMLARGSRVVATGSSDSHTLRSEWAGYPRTYVRVEGGIEDVELLAADGGIDAGTDDGLDAGTDGGLDASVVDAGDASVDAGAVSGAELRVTEGTWRLQRALREGRAFVTNGPLIDVSVGGHGPGETAIVRRGRAELRVEVRAPEWIDVSSIDVYVGSRIVRTIGVRPRRRRRDDPPGLRVSERVPLRLSEPTFVLVVVRGEETMDTMFGRTRVSPLAFSNPIWLEPER